VLSYRLFILTGPGILPLEVRMSSPASGFTHILVRLEQRLLIRSSCSVCGESKLVSHSDGSLDEWENGHRCRKSPFGEISEEEKRTA
jgi:hypothetical protein